MLSPTCILIGGYLVNERTTNCGFRHLVDSLKRPSPPPDSKPYWPYPLPEAEMMPMARAGWAFGELSRAVVWIAETYPGYYLVRFPGGATLLAPFNEMSWTAPSASPTPLGRLGLAVADDVPTGGARATTLVDAKIAEHRKRQNLPC
jgi:hypothetical protein